MSPDKSANLSSYQKEAIVYKQHKPLNQRADYWV